MPREATAVAAGKHLVQLVADHGGDHVVQPRRDDEFVRLDGATEIAKRLNIGRASVYRVLASPG
jgi:Helix-turn-helix domain of resolvase